MRVANCSQARPSQLAQGAHHVKNNACLAGLTKMQMVPNDNVEEVVWGKSPIARRFDVLTGENELLLPVWEAKKIAASGGFPPFTKLISTVYGSRSLSSVPL
jgi:hypothetical protein